jgi:hypothetical protein
VDLGIRDAKRRSGPAQLPHELDAFLDAGRGWLLWKERNAMAICGLRKQCRSVCLLLSVLLLSFAIVSHGVSEENSFVVSRHIGDASVGLVGRSAAPCDSATEVCGVRWCCLG